jgi:hypothetical protein
MSVWYLPKKLLVEYSTFFAAALNGNFAEGKTHCVALPEEDPDIFQIFVQWLYRGGALSRSDSRVCREFPETHIRAWALGDKLGCSKLQDTAMIQINRFHENTATCAKEMHMIYEITAPGSRLRKFAIDEFRWDSDNFSLCEREVEDDFFDMGAFTPEIKDDYWYATTHMSRDVLGTNPTKYVGRYLEDPNFRVNYNKRIYARASINPYSGTEEVSTW